MTQRTDLAWQRRRACGYDILHCRIDKNQHPLKVDRLSIDGCTRVFQYLLEYKTFFLYISLREVTFPDDDDGDIKKPAGRLSGKSTSAYGSEKTSENRRCSSAQWKNCIDT